MAGILANSATVAMVSGDTSANKVQAGYILGEQITLSTNPTGSSYSWGQSIPSGSAVAKTALTSNTDAAPRFTPDIAGEFVITVTVDGTTSYVIRCTVTDAAAVGLASAIRFLPVLDASVPTPSTGVNLFYSSSGGVLRIKKTDGTTDDIETIN